MASKEEATGPLNCQTWVLKVPIHCEGCKKKVKKILRNVSGVHSVDIDMQQNKVTVTGDVDADTLIRRLAKSGKHADMWPEKKPANSNLSPTSSPKAKDKVTESEADKVTAADKTPAGTASEPETKPVEKSKISPDTETPKLEKERAQTSTAKATGSGKRNEKKQGESSSSSSEAAAATMDGHSGNFPHDRPYLAPVYLQHPAYAVSHSTVHPMASHSYYYAHLGHPCSGYNYNRYNSDYHDHYGSSMESTTSQSHPYSDYDSQKPLRSYSYYDSTELRASPSHSSSTQGGHDMFSDENANGCSVM